VTTGRPHARVDPAKITRYLLDGDHPDNGGKAAFFLSFGFAPERWELLAQALIEHQSTNPTARTVEVAWGRMLTVECSMMSPDGRNPCIRSVWADDSEGRPLVTAYPPPRSQRRW
jgi:filamentous hemagglutinin